MRSFRPELNLLKKNCNGSISSRSIQPIWGFFGVPFLHVGELFAETGFFVEDNADGGSFVEVRVFCQHSHKLQGHHVFCQRVMSTKHVGAGLATAGGKEVVGQEVVDPPPPATVPSSPSSPAPPLTSTVVGSFLMVSQVGRPMVRHLPSC